MMKSKTVSYEAGPCRSPRQVYLKEMSTTTFGGLAKGKNLLKMIGICSMGHPKSNLLHTREVEHWLKRLVPQVLRWAIRPRIRHRQCPQRQEKEKALKGITVGLI